MWGGVISLFAIAFAAGAPQEPQEPAPDSLPRFQRLWQLDGLGRFDGAGRGNVYYTVANDGASAQAIDVTQGKVVWKTRLPFPAAEQVVVRLVTGGLVVAYRKQEITDDLELVGLTAEGRLRWSRTQGCPSYKAQAAANHFVLECHRGSFQTAADLIALDGSTGKPLGLAKVEGARQVTPAGEICGATPDVTWCGPLRGNRIRTRWRMPGTGAFGIDLTVAENYLVIASFEKTVVHRLADGRALWQRPGKAQIWAHEGRQQLFMLGERSLDVVRLADGKPLASHPRVFRAAGRFISDGATVLATTPRAGDAAPVQVVDSNLRARTVAGEAFAFGHIVGGVLLVHDDGSRKDPASVPLVAYSSSRLRPPPDPRDTDARVQAVFERFPRDYESHSALTFVRRIPGWQDALDKLIRGGAPRFRPAAMAVAGESRDPRLLPPLKQRLDAIAGPPATVEDWGAILDVARPVSQLRTPAAAQAMLAFWKRVGQRVQPAWRRMILKDMVAEAVWREGARKEWAPCADMRLPVGKDPPERAILGTRSPAVEYAVGGQRRWAAICEARRDDDGNGKLETVMLQHGDTGGDQLQPYLVLGSGAGTEIDDLVSGDARGDWVVVTKDMCVHLVNTQTGQTTVLEGADGRPGDPVVGTHRAARFSPDGNQLLYLRTAGDRTTVVYRGLSSGRERYFDPGAGEFHQAYFDPLGRIAVLEVVTQDTDGDGSLSVPRVGTTLNKRRCRAPFLSASGYGELYDRPIQRVVAPLGDAIVRDAPAGASFAPSPVPEPRDQLVPETPAPAHDFKAPIARGPFRWARSP